MFVENRPNGVRFGRELSIRLENVMRLMDTSRQILHSKILFMAKFGGSTRRPAPERRYHATTRALNCKMQEAKHACGWTNGQVCMESQSGDKERM